GIVRLSGALARALAERALPRLEQRRLDLAAAPRRALAITLQVTSLLGVGVPVVAITQPFLPGGPLAALLAVARAGAAGGIAGGGGGRGAPARAGGGGGGGARGAKPGGGGGGGRRERADIQGVLPGTGEPVPFRLAASSPAVRRTLAQLNLRGLSGATVLAIR